MDLQAEVDELRARVRQLTKDVDSLEQTNREFGKGHLAEWTHQEQRLIAIEEKLKSLSLSEETVNAIVRVGQREINERIDQVVEIIGTRVGNMESYLEGEKKLQPAAPFPTGGASTAEAAADAVLPLPQRGDRVRLEGARSQGGSGIPDGWYDVIGRDHGGFQVRTHHDALYWVSDAHPGLKEVRHAGD